MRGKGRALAKDGNARAGLGAGSARGRKTVRVFANTRRGEARAMYSSSSVFASRRIPEHKQTCNFLARKAAAEPTALFVRSLAANLRSHGLRLVRPFVHRHRHAVGALGVSRMRSHANHVRSWRWSDARQNSPRSRSGASPRDRTVVTRDVPVLVLIVVVVVTAVFKVGRPCVDRLMTRVSPCR